MPNPDNRFTNGMKNKYAKCTGVSIFFLVYGAGATKSSVSGLQKALTSRYKYCFHSSVSPSGSIIGGRVLSRRVLLLLRGVSFLSRITEAFSLEYITSKKPACISKTVLLYSHVSINTNCDRMSL